MYATYTIRHEYPAAALETIARMPELKAAKTAAMLIAAPLLGLVFVIALPIAGLALAAWMLVKALKAKGAAVAAVAKRVALFFAAPFVALAYIVAFPFVALVMLVHCGVRRAPA